MKTTHAALLCSVLLLAGCAPALIGAALTEPSHTRESREQFQRRFDGTNLARREQAQPELDQCSERYWFDRSWARKDRVCAARVRRYENGDSTALDPPGARLPRTVASVPESVQRVYDEREKVKLREAWKYESPGR